VVEPQEAVRRVMLDDRAVVSVPVATNRVTRISFAEAIAAFADPLELALLQEWSPAFQSFSR